MSLSDAAYWDQKATDRCNEIAGVLHIKGDPERWELISQFVLQFMRSEDAILEIGGGSGIVATKIYNKLKCVPDYINIDISPAFVEFVSKKIGLKSVVGTASDLPFDDNLFDSVWLFDVLEHISPEKRSGAGVEIGRVLKDSGAVFINNPIYQSKHNQDFEWLIADHGILEMFQDFRIHMKSTYWIKQAPNEFIILTRFA